MDKTEKFWDKQAKGYTDQQHHVQLNENKDFITTLKYLNSNDIVLDYGCGGGIVSAGIANKVKEVHAIDVSSEMIEVAKANAVGLDINNVHYAQATIFDERFQKESFNVILAFRVLHVLDDVPAAIRRTNELLKPGGVFISVTSCMGSPKGFMGIVVFLARKLGILPIQINMLKLPGLQGLLTGEEFELVESEKMDDRVPTYCIVARKAG